VDGSREFVDEMHGTLSTVAIHQGLVIAPDLAGALHCLDADTGRRYWSYDMLSAVWATPLIVGELVYLADEEGRVVVFRLSKDPAVAMKKVDGELEPIAAMKFGTSIYSSPVFANDTLYVATRHELLAIAAPQAPANRAEKPEARSDASAPRARSRDVASREARSIFAPTPQDVVEKMLEVAEVKKADTVVDLGSGDGRIVLTAARQYRARSIGYEIDSELVAAARETARRDDLTDLVEIRHQDMYTADLSKVQVATVFLYPSALAKMRPQYLKMERGARILSHHYAIPGAKHDRVVTFKSNETGDEHRIWLYVTPLSLEEIPK
jgi:hypothetical protein